MVREERQRARRDIWWNRWINTSSERFLGGKKKDTLSEDSFQITTDLNKDKFSLSWNLADGHMPPLFFLCKV